MHVNVTGLQRKGEPLVILEGGHGCFSADWERIQNNESLSKDIQVMSYDRAGMGWSGKVEEDVSAETSLANLEALLKAGDFKPPYLFVGHSYGGLLGQLFAIRHPDDVVGMILVDCAIEETPPPQQRDNSSAFEFLPKAAQNTFFQPNRAEEFGEKNSALVHRLANRTNQVNTLKSELDDFDNSARLLKASLKKEGPTFQCPLKVITAALENIDGGEIRNKERWELWQQKQGELKNRSTAGEQIVAAESDHFIPYHEPELIVKQISSFFQKRH